MIKELITLANTMDARGLSKEADALDLIILAGYRQDQMMEERNYMNDRRTNAEDAWANYDETSKMLVIYTETYDEDDNETTEELHLPAKLEVCDLCRGEGRTVNPSIDAGGLTQEDFDEDPDFREDYFSGAYDIPCGQCQGKRVVPVVDEGRLNAEQKKAFTAYQDDQYDRAREAESDRITYMREMGWG